VGRSHRRWADNDGTNFGFFMGGKKRSRRHLLRGAGVSPAAKTGMGVGMH